MTLTQELKRLHKLKQEYSEADKEAKRLKAEFEAAQSDLFARMEAEEVSSQKVDGVANFVRAETIYAKVQDRSEFVKWATENDDSLLEIRERKEDGILNDLVRRKIEDNEPLPPGLGFTTKQYIGMRAA